MSAKAARRAQLKVVAIVGSAVLLGAVGLSEVSGYATIPGIYIS